MKQVEVEEKSAVISVEKEKADEALAEALPAVAAAAEALENLDKKDLVEIKAFAQPPPLVKAVCLQVLALNPTKQKLDPDWKGAKTMLGNSRLLELLKECINEVWDDVKDGGAHWWMEFHPYLIVPKTLGATFYAYSEGERWRITARTCGELRCEALDYSWTNVTGLKKAESTWDVVKYLSSSKL